MKIQRLFLRNVRSIKNLDLDFRDPVTGKPMSRIVLIGANGSGKTTILETLYRLVGSTGAISPEEWRNWLGPLKLHGAQAQVIIDSFWDYDDGSPVRGYTNPASVFVGSEPIEAETFPAEDWSNAPKGMQHVTYRNPHEVPYDALGNIIYFPREREIGNAALDQLTAEEEVFQWAYKYENLSKWAGSVESYLVWQNYLDLEDIAKGKPAERFKTIVYWLNDILADKEIAGVERGRVVVGTHSGEMHGLGELSSGEKQLAILLIEILRRAVKGSVILIDEPEISLHAAWQRGLMATLDRIIEAYDAQVILATHSEEIATSVMPHEVISLSDLDNMPRGEWNPEVESIP